MSRFKSCILHSLYVSDVCICVIKYIFIKDYKCAELLIATELA